MKKFKRMTYEDLSKLYNKLFYIWIFTSLISIIWLILFYYLVPYIDIYGGDNYLKLLEIAKLNWNDVKSLGAIGYYKHLMNNFNIVILIIWISLTGLIIIYKILPIKILYIPLAILVFFFRFLSFIIELITIVIIPSGTAGILTISWVILLITFIIQIIVPIIEIIIFAIIGMIKTV